MPNLTEALASQLADNIQATRKGRGLSQDELAASAGFSRTHLAALEQNRRLNPRLSSLVRLAAALNSDVVELIRQKSETRQEEPEAKTAEALLKEQLGQQTERADPFTRLRTNLRRLRIEHELSQDTLSQTAGVFRTYVGKIERGLANPTIGDLESLARVLDVAVSELLE